MATFRCEVYIRPRPDILDPQGDAVGRALADLGFAGATDVRIGRYLTLSLEAGDETAAREQLDKMCARLLANPITEDFEIKLSRA